jgi:hypothetical protein
MAKAPAGRKSKTIKRKLPSAHQEGALGAGGTSALIVIARHLWPDMPPDLLSAGSFFTSLGFIYIWAVIKRSADARRERKELEDYEKALDDMLRDDRISEDKKKELKARWEEIRILRVEAKEQRVISRHEEIIASVSTSVSGV